MWWLGGLDRSSSAGQPPQIACRRTRDVLILTVHRVLKCGSGAVEVAALSQQDPEVVRTLRPRRGVHAIHGFFERSPRAAHIPLCEQQGAEVERCVGAALSMPGGDRLPIEGLRAVRVFAL